MSPEDFVAQIRVSIVRGNTAIYKDLFESTKSQDVTDAYWKQALTLYCSLSDGDRVVFLDVLQQVTVDAVSSLLGVLDGSSSLEPPSALTLTSFPDDQKLNGSLQDLFLEAEDRERAKSGRWNRPG
jgi:hypothetical protein